MKLNLQPRLLLPKDPNMERELREHAQQVNLLTEGRISAVYNATSSVPTNGTYAPGDFVRNSAPAELGTAGSRYVIFGWLCVVGGTPGTFVQCRFLTGS